MAALISRNLLYSNKFHRSYGRNISFISSLVTSTPFNLPSSCINHRSIFTVEALGIDRFNKQRAQIEQQNSDDEAQKFRDKMRELLDRSSHSLMLVFKQDLEKAIFLCRKEEELDLQLIRELAVKFNEQKSKVRFGVFKFGSVILRLCYVLDRPDVALELVALPELQGMFSDPSSYQLLMSLLYKHELYNEILDIMTMITTGRCLHLRYPRTCVMISLAAALKLGTEESLKKGLDLAESCKASSAWPHRYYDLAATIALQSSRPDVALQLLHNTSYARFTTIRNILISAWCEMGRLEQVMSLLRPLAADMKPGSLNTAPCVYQHIYEQVKAAVRQQRDMALSNEFARIERALLDGGGISEKTLLENVLLPMEMADSLPGKRRVQTDFHKPFGHHRREELLDEGGS